MAEIEEPPGRQPPPRRTGGGSDMSGKGLAKASGGCCVTYCLLGCGVIFLITGLWLASLFTSMGLPFVLIGAVCCILGLVAARWEWRVIKGS